MKKVRVVIFLLILILLPNFSLPPVYALSQATILPNYTGYLDLTTIPITYHVVGEISNAGTTILKLLNVTAAFYAQNNAIIGYRSAFALLNTLLPTRKTPFEIIWVGSTANQIHNYTLALQFSEYPSEKTTALQILEDSNFIEAGFRKFNGTIKNLGMSNATNTKVIATVYDSLGNVAGTAYDYTTPPIIAPSHSERFELELSRKAFDFSSYTLTVESTEYAAATGFVTINNGAIYTTTTSVTLTLTADINVTKMRFSNDNTTFTEWETYTSSKIWNLQAGEGTRIVYAQYMDSSNSTSPSYYDTIVLDTTPPTLSITSPINGSETGPLIAVMWTASDATSGIDHYEIKLDNESWIAVGTNTTCAFNMLSAGNHTVTVKAASYAGLYAQNAISFSVNSNSPNARDISILVASISVAIVAVAVYTRRNRARKRRRTLHKL